MAQSLIQTQAQQQAQLQKLSPQQLLQVKLMELPINELEQRISTEMYANPALESSNHTDDNESFTPQEENEGFDDYEANYEREERQSALNEALENMSKDDEMPVYNGGNGSQNGFNEVIYGDSVSFYDKLNEQMSEIELTDKQQQIMEYLIGPLDDDGLLRKNLGDIGDELAINYYIDASDQETEDTLHILQTFDPAGIGACSLQECLLLQIKRREDSKAKELMLKIISKYFEEFTKKRWDKIQQHLDISDLQAKVLADELRKLNPKPGASLSESIDRSMQQITPDFIVETDNDGNVPELHVSPSFAESMDEFQNNKQNMSRQVKEALLYTKKKIDAAQSFIDAIKQRKHTLYITMKAIIQVQHRFFKDSYVTENGDELSTRQIKIALQEIVDNEDKKHPMSDDALKEILNKKGYPIARRTIAKYREQLGIPVARLRK